MPSHSTLYIWGWGLPTLVWGWMWWLRPFVLKMGHYTRVCIIRPWGNGSLPQGLMIQNAYTEMHNGRKNVTVIVRNSMAYPQAEEEDPCGKSSCGHMGARATNTDWHDRGIRQGPRPSDAKADCEAKAGKSVWEVRSEWMGVLATWAGGFHLVSLGWVPWHFLLRAQQTQLYWLTKHVIKVTDDAPFKGWFRWIPLPLVEEVCTHLWEMLDSGMICPSQSVWCNVVVLVWKKDGGLCFCIAFCCLHACTKKDSYPLLRIQESLESLVAAGHFSCLDLKSGFWQIMMDELSKQYTAFTIGNLGFFKCDHMLWAVQHTSHVSEVNAKLPWGAESNILPHLPWWHSHFLTDSWEHLYCLHIVFDWVREHNLKLKPSKCSFFRKEITYLAHWISKNGMWSSNWNLEAITECVPSQMYTEVHAFLSLVGHYKRFIKRFTCISQPLSKYLTGEGASRKSEWVSLTEDALKVLKCWSRCVWQLPFWLLLTTLNHSCWRLMHPKIDWGQYCHRSRQTGSTTPSPMATGPLHLMRRTTTQLSSSF